MAETKRMQLVASEPLGVDGRRMEFECPAPLIFRGGQFLIVDTGLVQADGKAVKCCFSILSADEAQTRIQLAVQRVGLGTEALTAMALGTEVSFSGPWGKIGPTQETPVAPGLVVATDTGITGALGLLRSQAMVPFLAGMRFLWLAPTDGGLLSYEEVERGLPRNLAGFHYAEIAPVNSPERIGQSVAALDAMQGLAFTADSTVWLLGDGQVIGALRVDLLERYSALSTERVVPEYYFHSPRRR